MDKTDLVWQLAHHAPYVFLSRPRRFGKSLLTSTLESYFKGDKELFEGLKIMDYETEWKRYPVIRLDLSIAKSQDNAKALQARLMLMLRDYTKVYGQASEETTPGGTLQGIIQRAYEQTGMQVAVIIDEYDAPLLEVLHDDTRLENYHRVMQEFYVPLKASERYIRFCFITGITKFSQLSIFSTINNLKNVTMDPKFAAICGITEEELLDTFQEGIAGLADYYGCSTEEMQRRLKLQYDGYHFSEDSPGIYNPFSLLNAFLDCKMTNGWFASGTPTFLIRQMQHFRTDIAQLDGMEAFASDFDLPTEAMTTALPLLYQSGYLTIKDYDPASQLYSLGLPNQEVRIGFAEGLMPVYTGLETRSAKAGFALKFWRALQKHDLDLALREMQSYLAGIPYVEGFKKKLAEAANAEGFYEYTFYLIFSMLNVYVRTQVKCAGGRIDMVVWMPDTTYVLELKTEGTAQDALAQIDSHDYALPYQTEGRKVVKAGVKVNPDTRTIEDWAIAQ